MGVRLKFRRSMEFNPAFTKTELCHFLVNRGVEEDDAQKLRDEKVDGETFQDITEADLREIGVKLGTRKKIMKIIQNIKQSLLENAELQDLQILGGDSTLSNSLVFDLITASNSCTVISTAASPTISSTTSLAPATELLPSSSTSSEKTPAISMEHLETNVKKKAALSSSYLSEILPPRLNSTVADLCTENATGQSLSIYADPENIDVLSMLTKHTSGRKIMNNLKTGKGISRTDISEIVRIVVHAMIEDLRTLYPSSNQKVNLAKAIVRDIPELKSNREGVAGYEQFYDPKHNSGSIEWRLKTLRVRIPASRKKRRPRTTAKSKEVNQEEEEEDEEFTIDYEALAKVSGLSYPCPLPTFSPTVKKDIEDGTVHQNFGRFVRECGAFLLTLVENPTKSDYDVFCRTLSNQYEFINDNSISVSNPYAFFKSTLSRSIRNARHYNKKVKSIRIKDIQAVIDTDKVDLLKSQPAVDINKSEIFKGMEETFKLRRNMIVKRKLSISDILEEFPKLKEFDGELINAEFKLMYPDAGNLLDIFPTYSEKIRIYVSQKRQDIEERVGHVTDDDLRAMMYLADLLPIAGMKKRKLDDERFYHPSETLITFTGENSSLTQEDLSKYPRLLCCGEMQDEQLQFFLVLDKEYVDLGKCFLKAFDILYKSYKVFNVDYPKNLALFYSFVDTMIYKINTGVVRSNVEHLNNVLCCVNTNL